MLAGSVPTDLAAYRAEAEEFLSSIDREYYLHYSGQQDEFEIEPIYDAPRAGSSRARRWTALREAGAPPALVEFAVQGLIGQEMKAGAAELARREAALEIEWDGETLPYRSAAVLQANEPDADRRAALEEARNAADWPTELNPLTRELLERSHELARELGWPSMRDAVRGPVGHRPRRAGRADRALPRRHGGRLRAAGGARAAAPARASGFDRLRRSDLTRLLPRARRSTRASRRSASCRRSRRRSPGWGSTWPRSRA